jgi:hypothetical protein
MAGNAPAAANQIRDFSALIMSKVAVTSTDEKSISIFMSGLTKMATQKKALDCSALIATVLESTTAGYVLMRRILHESLFW